MDESLHIVPGVGFSSDTTWIRGSSRELKTSPNSSANVLEANNNKSVSFGKAVSFGPSTPNNSNPNLGGGSQSRVAMMKAKLRDSFTANSLMADASYSNNNYKNSESFSRGMDASWGGALGMVEDMSDSDDSEDDSDDDSFGEFGGLNDKNDLDESVNFRKQAQQSVSFNMSFMHVGLDDDDDDLMGASSKMGGSSRMGGSARSPMGGGSARSPMGGRRLRQPKKNTGRGSIFVIADEKLGKTKVIQVRLEKAAKKMQRFFRLSLLVLRQYNDEADYLKNEIKDTASRRVEELADVQQFIQDEKEQFRMEMEREWNAGMWTPEEWEAHDKEQADLKAEIQALKEENQTLKNDSKILKHENDKLAIVDPTRESERTQLEIQVQKLEIDNMDWSRIQTTYVTAVEDAQRKVDSLIEKRKEKRAHRKRMAKAIKKIIQLLEEHPTEPIENPKLLSKVNKLKDKRERKMLKLKAKTIMEQQQLEQQQPLTEINEDEEHAHEERAAAEYEQEKLEKQKRKERRKSKKQDADDGDLPELNPAAAADNDGTQAEGEEPIKKKRNKKKNKSNDDSLSKEGGDSALMLMYEAAQQAKNASGEEANDDGTGEEPIKKKRSKKKNKSYDDSFTRDRSSKEEGDDALMMMYKAQQQKKNASGPEGDTDETVEEMEEGNGDGTEGEKVKKKRSKKKNKSYDDSLTMRDRSSKEEGDDALMKMYKSQQEKKNKGIDGESPEDEVEGGGESGKTKKKKSRRKTVAGSGPDGEPPAHTGALFALFT